MDEEHRRAAIDRAIDVLNEALAADPQAVIHLMNLSVKVNTPELRDHPSIQVGGSMDAAWVRPLGLINGILGVNEDGYGYVAMKCGQDFTIDAEGRPNVKAIKRFALAYGLENPPPPSP